MYPAISSQWIEQLRLPDVVQTERGRGGVGAMSANDTLGRWWETDESILQSVLTTNYLCAFIQGPPLAGRYYMGAICMQEHADRLQNLVNDALEKGAEIAGRGSFGHLDEDAGDQFFPSIVLINVDHTMKLMQKEAFGPVIPIMKFSSDEEVVNLANDSKYRLGCAVFSGNQKRSRAIASQLHCGIAAINDLAANPRCWNHNLRFSKLWYLAIG